jgi:ABC-type transport system involved in cytochrome c biogenesis permease subunit
LNEIGVLHIVLSLAAYVAYFYVTVKSLSHETPYRVLLAANILYVVGLGFGLIWAKEAWGFYLNWDVKSIVSVLIPVPFIAENALRRRSWVLPVAGSALIIMNYLLPMLIASVHVH